MVDVIRNILHTTIKSVYPKYYPKEVVDFFCEHHSAEHIKEGIATGRMGMLTDGEIVVGTGCYYENEITGVYVLPEYQGKGYGTVMNMYVSLDKRSKKAQREYHAKQRRTWGELNPVTRSVPSGKTYNRKKEKQRIGKEFRNGFDADLFCKIIYFFA